MHDYRKASSEVELKRVDQYKHDNNFYNWEDPEVLKYFTKNTNSVKKAWKKTHGFPYATAVPPWKPTNESLAYNATKCWKKCASYVSSYYNIHSVFLTVPTQNKKCQAGSILRLKKYQNCSYLKKK